MQYERVQECASNLQIKRKFIAELALWWGGLYERLIRSFKTRMNKVIGTSLPDKEL